jgi:hypothetical protein
VKSGELLALESQVAAADQDGPTVAKTCNVERKKVAAITKPLVPISEYEMQIMGQGKKQSKFVN